MNINKSVLIIGGYGVVGQQVAKLIRERHPSIPILIGGRNPNKGKKIAIDLKNADTFKVDLNISKPLNGQKPMAIISTTNDNNDFLAIEAANNGIPYLDITRWTEKLKKLEALLSILR